MPAANLEFVAHWDVIVYGNALGRIDADHGGWWVNAADATRIFLWQTTLAVNRPNIAMNHRNANALGRIDLDTGLLWINAADATRVFLWQTTLAVNRHTVRMGPEDIVVRNNEGVEIDRLPGPAYHKMPD
jgi:hypothetical protein